MECFNAAYVFLEVRSVTPGKGNLVSQNPGCLISKFLISKVLWVHTNQDCSMTFQWPNSTIPWPNFPLWLIKSVVCRSIQIFRQWNILGLCEVHWKNFGETSTPEGHKLFFSGCEDRHEHGVGFLIHKDTVNAIMGCQPVSSRLISILLKASPFNITIEDFYDQLQEVIDQAPKKDILVVQGYLECKDRRWC